jgi:hypothetical protein
MRLPKVYEDRNGLFPQHKGKPKGSYSQVTSYRDEKYRYDYYVQYFFGFQVEGNEFSDFGGSCGEVIQAIGEKWETIPLGVLSDEDVGHIKNIVDFPPNSKYEDEICADFVDFVMEGYIDRAEYVGNVVNILDYKTGNIGDKVEYYGNKDYGQTVLYGKAKEDEGFEVGYCGVHLLGRKGSSLSGTGNHKMRLSGEHAHVETPYSKARAKEVEKEIRTVINQIANDYEIYLKFIS